MDRAAVTTVDVGGGRTLAAWAVGDGPPVVLIHEGIADSRMWKPVVPALARYRVITYDLPGFGESPLVGGGEISTWRISRQCSGRSAWSAPRSWAARSAAASRWSSRSSGRAA